MLGNVLIYKMKNAKSKGFTIFNSDDFFLITDTEN